MAAAAGAAPPRTGCYSRCVRIERSYIVVASATAAEGLISFLVPPYLDSVHFPVGIIGVLVASGALASLASRVPARAAVPRAARAGAAGRLDADRDGGGRATALCSRAAGVCGAALAGRLLLWRGDDGEPGALHRFYSDGARPQQRDGLFLGRAGDGLHDRQRAGGLLGRSAGLPVGVHAGRGELPDRRDRGRDTAAAARGRGAGPGRPRRAGRDAGRRCAC